jgi:signal transduction histidine kinase
MRIIADDRAIDLQSDSPAPVSIDGDREHLRRLLLNLIDNAVKYTPSGGSVKITLHPEKSGASFAVSDTGIGLSAAEQKQIFNRFHRSTETRARDVKGVGLGLSIVHSIVAAHGGRIHVDSTPGQGSTFTVYLPDRPA